MTYFVLAGAFLSASIIASGVRLSRLDTSSLIVLSVCGIDTLSMCLGLVSFGFMARTNAMMMDSVVTVSMQSIGSLKDRLPEILADPDDADKKSLPPISKADLREGKLLGRGAYGAVYR